MLSCKKGFTFIELIIVITIIMVLTVGATVSFQQANKKARDGRRIADMEKARSALEFYRQDNGSYPANTGALSPNYLQSWPSGPQGDTYVYTRPTNYSYTLDGYMETQNNGSYGSCPSATYPCNYRLINP